MSPSRDIPFNKLVLSQSNVRRTKAGISIEDLAEDIPRRRLLQGLNVRPILDADGQESGVFDVPAGGRRYRALELLVKQKRLAKTAPIPCIVSEAGTEISAEEDSLHGERAPRRPFRFCVRTVLLESFGCHRDGSYPWGISRRHTDVRVKRSRSVARTALDAAATPQTSQMVAGEVLQPCHAASGRARGEPLAS
jgi:ParB/Sulfiredoxin domain